MNGREEFAKLLGDQFYKYLLEKHPELAEDFKKFKIEMVEEN